MWRHLQDIRKASDWGLVHRGGISGRLDLEMGRDGGDTDREKYGGRIVDKQVVRQFFGSWFVSSHEKPFGGGKLVRCVHV